MTLTTPRKGFQEPCFNELAPPEGIGAADCKLLPAPPEVADDSQGLLEGQRDLVSRFIRGITRVTIWAKGITNLFTKSP